MTKIIMHCHDPENLVLMARAAKFCIEADMVEGDWKSLCYGEGQLAQPVYICAIKRKSCVTLYDQPLSATKDRA